MTDTARHPEPIKTPESAWDAAARLARENGEEIPKYCPARVREACDILEWDYEITSVNPRMYGQCDYCRGVFIFVLPRQRSGYKSPLIRPLYEHPAKDRVEYQAGALMAEMVTEAGELTFKQSGIAQRLYAVIHEHPIYLRREILFNLFQTVEKEFKRINRGNHEHIQHMLEVARDRYDRSLEFYLRASMRQARGNAVKVLEALKALRARMSAEQKEAKAIRSRLSKLRAEVNKTREAAHREPLPKPIGYVVPTVDPGSILCDRLHPPELIYALVDPADPELVRYVGRTVDAVQRYGSHCEYGSDSVSAWVREVRGAGRSPTMVLLERTERELTGVREAYWIHYYRDRFQADLNRAIPRREIA